MDEEVYNRLMYKEEVMQKANELKAMFTNDGNVILFNIHFTADLDANSVASPLIPPVVGMVEL